MRPDSAVAVLPMPLGEPGGLWSAAGALRAAAEAVTGAPLAASGGEVGPLDGWTGEAAAAVREELTVVARREVAMADRLVRAAAVVGAYGDELDAAQRTVATLQRSWDAAVPTDPLAAWPDAALAGIAGLHAVVSADLQLAADVAAHRLRGLVGDVVAVDAPGRHRTPVWGWADPAPSDAAVREATLADLPVVSGVVARREADELAEQVVGDLMAIASGDSDISERVAVRLGARSRDPVVAQALWERLDPDTAGRLVDVLTGFGGEAATALLAVLGAALATAVNPAYAGGADPVTRSRVDAWRERWLAQWAANVGGSRRLPEGRAVAATWVQGVLMTGAWRSGLSPGSRYAVTVGVAVVAADRAMQSSSVWPAAGGLSGPRSAERDPVLAVARALEHDAEAARAWLLAPLPDGDRRLVVEHLVQGRYRSMDPAAAAVSMAATAHLVTMAGGDPARRDAVVLDAAFLGAAGSEGRATTEPDAYRVALAPALADIGTVLARHPDAVTAALDDSAALGVDADLVADADRLTRPGRTPGTWEAVLPDRPAAAALAGLLAFDPGSPGSVGGSSGEPGDPRDPGSAPALGRVLESLGARLESDLVDAVAADRAGDAHALDAAAHRLGEVVGFTLTSAGEGLARRDADADERNRVLAGLAQAAAGKVVLPGVARVATPLVRMAADRVSAATLPSDTEAAQRRATTQATDEAMATTAVEVRALVSRARPWTADQAPAAWAVPRGTVRFWGDDGAPLPETVMTTEQRRAFTAWRRDVGLSVYDTAPQVVRDGIEAGVRGGRPGHDLTARGRLETLPGHQLRERPRRVREDVEGSVLHDAPSGDDHHAVRGGDRGQPVRDDDPGDRHPADRPGDHGLGEVVQARWSPRP